MAILADLIAFVELARLPGGRIGGTELPPKKVYHISAAGFQDIDVDAASFIFRNLAGSQAVAIRLNQDADNTAANGTTDSQSIRVDIGKEVQFSLPPGVASSGYKLSVI